MLRGELAKWAKAKPTIRSKIRANRIAASARTPLNPTANLLMMNGGELVPQ
jgi:hypothetical protein